MGKTYILTTPLMGRKNQTDRQHIEAFQRMLMKHGFYHGAIDGIYGLDTAAAVYKAKYKLGYLKPDHAAGDRLYGYLAGSDKPSLAMKALANRRIGILHGEHLLREKALSWYVKNNGRTEHPAGSNHSFVTDWYGMVGPWCAMTFVMAYAQSGSKKVTKASAHKHNWAFVPNIEHDAKRNLNGLSVTHNPMAGHGVCFDWPGESPGISDHIGVFEKWIDRKSGKFYSREGNTGIGNDSNGGEIMQRERSLSTVRAFVVVSG